MRLRSLILFVPLLASSSDLATASEPLDEVAIVEVVPEAAPIEVVVPAMALAVPDDVAWRGEAEDPSVSTPSAPSVPVLDEIFWTVEHAETVDGLASRWGLKHSALVGLNPHLRGAPAVQPGTKLQVYAHDDERPTRSVGAPNRGRLLHGMPLPEGPYWKLRERRVRAWGTHTAIAAMVTAFTRYGTTFEDAPRVSVGEISARRGGRAHPHRSHRTGRDVDLGYILRPGTEGPRWKRANADNFDAEKNWVLIKALVDTGEVQQIFISSRLQRLLEPIARRELSEEELARYFRVRGGGGSAAEDAREEAEATLEDAEPELDVVAEEDSEPPVDDLPEESSSPGRPTPILKHWKGHRDHMHVRFRCEPGNHRCRSRSS